MTAARLSLIAIALALTAYAGRPPAPVAVVQPTDRSLDCAQVAAEVQANDVKLVALGRESANKTGQNIAAGVAGLLIWPLWFAMDWQGSAGVDAAALQQRQSYLATLAADKKCGVQ